jgi:hypothetical protein
LSTFDLLSNVHGAIALLHAPTGHWVKRGRPESFTGASVEAGMVPGASHRILDEQPLLERGAIVRADSTDGKQLAALSGEKHRFALHVP